LAKQGRKQTIEYEVIFSEDYPISPPFFRVVFPRFKYQTGHVTVGGSICMQSLTQSGWTSARSIESYFVEILSLLNEGGARLDTFNLNQYSIYEAKEAFTRVARQHGWMK
jgi:ubiquitin-conjugating enzyme E2 Q